MDGAALHRGDRVRDVARLVQRVRVDRDRCAPPRQLGINSIVTLEKQLLNMIGKVV